MWHSSISDRRVAPSVHGPIWRRCCCASSSRKCFPLVVYVDCFGQSKQNTRASPEGCSRPWLRTAVARGSQSVRGHPHGPDGRWMTGWVRPVGGGCGGYDSGCCDTESPFVGNVMARGCQHTVSGASAEAQTWPAGLAAFLHASTLRTCAGADAGAGAAPRAQPVSCHGGRRGSAAGGQSSGVNRAHLASPPHSATP